MKVNDFSVHGYFEYAVLERDFDKVKACLCGHPNWATKVMAYAESKARIIELVRIFNKMHPCQIKQEKSESFITIGALGKKQSLVYRVENYEMGSVKITPLAFLETKYKVGIACLLALFYFVPVLLSPIIWHQRAEQNLRLSRYYLVSLCHYLENQLVD